MKTTITFLASCIVNCALCLTLSAQVQCIKCYNQNARVLTDTNNLIINGGFENNTNPGYDFCPNSTNYINGDSGTIANWICTGGGGDTYAHIINNHTSGSLSYVVEGIWAAYFGNKYPNACTTTLSDTSCIGSTGCEVTGILAGYPYNTANFGGDTGVSLQQTVNGLTTGAIYLLEFWAGGEWDYGNWHPGLFAVDVGFGKIFLRDPSTAPDSGVGIRYVIQFAATSSSHTIKFTNWGHIGYNGTVTCTELVLDDVWLLVPGPDDVLCATGVDEQKENKNVIVYPNPFTNSITITTNTSEESEIILYDVTSRVLLRRSFVNSATINTEQLAGGIYFYEVRDKDGVSARGKVVKQ